ncbi:hypothetical protein [Actinosynnema sp. NPDC020468]|uniref:COG4315 family predicted lipoprotein n=1 Tax=Actinosynnema sp. NPDC020468 TaxID=3154488 RepID=UPI0033F28A14
MIRRNRIAIAVAGGLAAVLALVVYTSNASGVDNRNVAQTGQAQPLQAQAAPEDYGTDAPLAPPTSEEPTTTTEPPQAQAAPAQDPAIAVVGTSVPKMGDVVQDGDGRTLYRFDKDTPNPAKSNCEAKCAETWPPLLVTGKPRIEGVDAAIVSTVKRADGSEQVTIAGWPVYTYSKDDGPGKWKGQGVGGTWFVIQPDGKRNVQCLPAGVTAPPAA